MVRRFFIVLIVLTTSIVCSQRGSFSPYSIIGIGNDFEPKTVEHSSMGGIGVAIDEVNYLNFVNPASYSNLRYATYSMGGLTKFLTLKNKKISEFGNATNLRYISLAFPLSSRIGFSTGLKPLSSVGYSLLNKKFSGEYIKEITRLYGRGGANKLFFSIGLRLFKGFSLGIESSFIFGNIQKTIINGQSKAILATKYQKKYTVRGYDLKIGTQYKINLNNKLKITTGITFKKSNTLKLKGDEVLYTLKYLKSGIEDPRDFLFNRKYNFKIKTPIISVFGVGIGKEDKWYFGVNTEFKKIIEKYNSKLYKFDNSIRTSIGGWVIPKIYSISSYWDRVTYRAGFRYEKTGLFVDVTKTGKKFTPINDFGINIGFGLPLPRQISNLNIGLEYGQKGTTNDNLVKENYFNVRLSLSLNSLNWFKKRKID